MKIIKSILVYFTRLCLMLIDNAKIDGFNAAQEAKVLLNERLAGALDRAHWCGEG